MDTTCSGNTIPSQVVAFNARMFQFTLNDVSKYDLLKAYLTSLKSLSYFISCKEFAPSTNHENIHIFTHFKNPYKISKKILDIGAHIEVCKGSVKQNIDYIRKDGNILDEIGDEPIDRRVRTVKDLEDTPYEEVPANLKRIKQEVDREKQDKQNFFDMLQEIKEKNLKAPTIIYITGGTGKGKTYSAYQSALQKYDIFEIGKLTLNNNFIDVVNESAKCFIIEEFRPSQIRASDFLQLTDKYGYRANVKGGFVSLRFETLYICSIIPPEEIYKEEINQQFIRRISETIDLDIDKDALI